MFAGVRREMAARLSLRALFCWGQWAVGRSQRVIAVRWAVGRSQRAIAV